MDSLGCLGCLSCLGVLAGPGCLGLSAWAIWVA